MPAIGYCNGKIWTSACTLPPFASSLPKTLPLDFAVCVFYTMFTSGICAPCIERTTHVDP
jgi:hypothetical protein